MGQYNQQLLPQCPTLVSTPAVPTQYPAPTFIPAIPPQWLSYVSTLEQQRYADFQENERLRNQLQQKQLAEEAYTTAISIANDQICAPSRYGTLLPILNRTIEKSLRLSPEIPLKRGVLYRISLSRTETPIFLDEQQYFNDSMLIAKLQEGNGVEVTVRKSQRATATLLRQAIARKMQILPVSVYAGWIMQSENQYRFTTFNPFSAHQKEGDQMSLALPSTSPAVAALAAQKWWTVFDPICDPYLCSFLFLWLHAAFLNSLLDKLKFTLPLGLYVFSPSPDIMAYLRGLFCWYGDPPLSLDYQPAMFAEELLYRKDQPLVVNDACRTKHALSNAAAVEDALISRSLPWKNGKDVHQLPLQALPTVLASTVSDLACSPSLISLDLSPDHFDRDRFQVSLAQMGGLTDYLTAFANYTSEHTQELQAALKTAYSDAWTISNGALTEPCIAAMGVMLGLRRFLEGFSSTYTIATPLTAKSEEELHDWLLCLLRETSAKSELSGSLADQFVVVSRSILQHRRLSLQPLASGKPVKGQAPVVYFDEEALYFTPEALRFVCGQLSTSRPVVLRALANANIIQGAPINHTTTMSRIRLWNTYGVPHQVPVYRLRRDTFDQLGDPLMLEEVIHQ